MAKTTELRTTVGVRTVSSLLRENTANATTLPERLAAAKQLEVVKAYAKENMSRLPYHNYRHVKDVVSTCKKLAYFEDVSTHEMHLLLTAAYLHDIVYVVGAKDNEEKSAEEAGRLLPALGYSSRDVGLVQDLIMATKLPTNPKERLEKVICDADLANLGREDFLEANEAVREELGVSKMPWLKGSLRFVAAHQYYTESGRSTGDYGKGYNIAALARLIRQQGGTVPPLPAN
jgi:predicted metal-dependent HD superfamily phosphohydrolase